MTDSHPELSSRYYAAERLVWVLSSVLSALHFLPATSGQRIPILNLLVEDARLVPRIVGFLLFGMILYLWLEWSQSAKAARSLPLSALRGGITVLIAGASFWWSYPTLVFETEYSGVSPAWFIAFIVVGMLIGACVSGLIFATLMIRTPEESRTHQLPRIPVATFSQYCVSIPILLALLGAYCLLHWLSPAVLHVPALVFTGSAFLLAGFAEPLSLFVFHRENGVRVPFAERVAQLKTIHDTHDYSYHLAAHGIRAVHEVGLTSNSPPKEIQQAIRQYAASDVRFRAKLLDDIEIKSHHKDGNLENNTRGNLGMRVLPGEHQADVFRVLITLDTPSANEREMQIRRDLLTTALDRILVEKDPAQVPCEALLSDAINSAVIETMRQESQPSLYDAAMSENEELVLKLLSDDGVDVNERVSGWTAVLAATAQGNSKIMRHLLDRGADPDIGNLLGITPLHYGAHYGQTSICRLLIKNGASTNQQDVDGLTPMMVSAQGGRLEIVRLLLDAGADIDLRDRNKKTALDLAQAQKQYRVAKLLRCVRRDRRNPCP